MFWCRHGQRKNIPDCLVKTWIGTVSEDNGQIFVLQVVLNVAHLMVNSEEVHMIYSGTLLDPEKQNKTKQK